MLSHAPTYACTEATLCPIYLRLPLEASYPLVKCMPRPRGTLFCSNNNGPTERFVCQLRNCWKPFKIWPSFRGKNIFLRFNPIDPDGTICKLYLVDTKNQIEKKLVKRVNYRRDFKAINLTKGLTNCNHSHVTLPVKTLLFHWKNTKWIPPSSNRHA